MATNEILQFAETDTGTNLLTQAEYLADAQRPIGNQPGVARSKLVNKALRQASLIAAGLAEYIADNQANNITDALTPQNIADYLQAAIQANIPVVPDASTTAKGIIEIATASEAQQWVSSLLAITPSTLNQSLKGSNQLLSENGYQKLHGGLFLQWGLTSTISEDSTITVTFPISFPNACVNVVNSVQYSVDGDINEVCHISNVTNTNYRVRNSNGRSTRTYWFAIGY